MSIVAFGNVIPWDLCMVNAQAILRGICICPFIFIGGIGKWVGFLSIPRRPNVFRKSYNDKGWKLWSCSWFFVGNGYNLPKRTIDKSGWNPKVQGQHYVWLVQSKMIHSNWSFFDKSVKFVLSSSAMDLATKVFKYFNICLLFINNWALFGNRCMKSWKYCISSYDKKKFVHDMRSL